MKRPGVRIPLPPVYARSGSGGRRLSRRSFSEGGPVGAWRTRTQRATTRQASFFFATLAAVAEGVDCRAEALAKADPLAPGERERSELRLGRPVSSLLRSQR